MPTPCFATPGFLGRLFRNAQDVSPQALVDAANRLLGIFARENNNSIDKDIEDLNLVIEHLTNKQDIPKFQCYILKYLYVAYYPQCVEQLGAIIEKHNVCCAAVHQEKYRIDTLELKIDCDPNPQHEDALFKFNKYISVAFEYRNHLAALYIANCYQKMLHNERIEGDIILPDFPKTYLPAIIEQRLREAIRWGYIEAEFILFKHYIDCDFYRKAIDLFYVGFTPDKTAWKAVLHVKFDEYRKEITETYTNCTKLLKKNSADIPLIMLCDQVDLVKLNQLDEFFHQEDAIRSIVNYFPDKTAQQLNEALEASGEEPTIEDVRTRLMAESQVISDKQLIAMVGDIKRGLLLKHKDADHSQPQSVALRLFCDSDPLSLTPFLNLQDQSDSVIHIDTNNPVVTLVVLNRDVEFTDKYHLYGPDAIHLSCDPLTRGILKWQDFTKENTGLQLLQQLVNCDWVVQMKLKLKAFHIAQLDQLLLLTPEEIIHAASHLSSLEALTDYIEACSVSEGCTMKLTM